MVKKHLEELEGLLQQVISKEHYEAAQVVQRYINLINAAHISNEYLEKENTALKANLTMHLTGLAMSSLVSNAEDRPLDSETAEMSFDMADAMLVEAKAREELAADTTELVVNDQ